MMKVQSPEQIARFIFAMTKGKPSLENVANGYIKSAAEMREYAEKAIASKTGKYRGYTAVHADATAELCERYAASVPAALRAMGVN